MDGQGFLLTPDGDVQHAGTGHSHDRLLVGRPRHGVAQEFEVIDREHFPAYLESSNPKNLTRYGRLGFEPREEFALAGDGPVVTTMWRPAR